jgi:hypothetical protein
MSRHNKRGLVWAVLWSAVCVLVLALWLRSYFYLDRCYVIIPGLGISVDHCIGQVHFGVSDMKRVHGVLLLPIHFGWDSGGAVSGGRFRDDTVWEFDYETYRNWSIHVPHWFIAFFPAVIATVPWIFALVSRRRKPTLTT